MSPLQKGYIGNIDMRHTAPSLPPGDILLKYLRVGTDTRRNPGSHSDGDLLDGRGAVTGSKHASLACFLKQARDLDVTHRCHIEAKLLGKGSSLNGARDVDNEAKRNHGFVCELDGYGRARTLSLERLDLSVVHFETTSLGGHELRVFVDARAPIGQKGDVRRDLACQLSQVSGTGYRSCVRAVDQHRRVGNSKLFETVAEQAMETWGRNKSADPGIY
jgi:hypothetical protein